MLRKRGRLRRNFFKRENAAPRTSWTRHSVLVDALDENIGGQSADSSSIQDLARRTASLK
jgi:hypothetical protein